MERRVLIVDDDKEIAQLIGLYLRNEGLTSTLAFDGIEALEEFDKGGFDLIILDIMMPRMDGMEVCRQLRLKHMVPILMLSAKAEDMDKIAGLMTGADDYMIKPFNPLELVARVRSLLRRSYQFNQIEQVSEQERDRLSIGTLTIHKQSHKVESEGRTIHLTSLEFGILYLLASHPGRVFSAEEIFMQVWQEKYFESNNTVMVHISKLRDKLEQETGDKLIVTVWGVGYKIED